MLSLNDSEKKGIVTAIAVSYVAAKLGKDTKVFMPKSASQYKIKSCHALSAEIVLADNFIELFKQVELCHRQATSQLSNV